MGRSKNTGNLTVVLYEDPQDTIPKIHVRTSKYMAWIAEMMLPSHLHVNRGKAIQFDQWRISHLAEFGICNYSDVSPNNNNHTERVSRRSESVSRFSAASREARASKRERCASVHEAHLKRKQEAAKAKTEIPENEFCATKINTDAEIDDSESKNIKAEEAIDKNNYETKIKFTRVCESNDVEMDESAKNSNAVKTNCNSNYEAKIKIPDKVVGESNDVDSDTGGTEKSKLPGTIKCDKTEGMNESVKVEVLNVQNIENDTSASNCGHCGSSFTNTEELSSHNVNCLPDEDFGFEDVSDETNESVLSSDPDSGLVTEEDLSLAEEDKKMQTNSKENINKKTKSVELKLCYGIMLIENMETKEVTKDFKILQNDTLQMASINIVKNLHCFIHQIPCLENFVVLQESSIKDELILSSWKNISLEETSNLVTLYSPSQNIFCLPFFETANILSEKIEMISLDKADEAILLSATETKEMQLMCVQIHEPIIAFNFHKEPIIISDVASTISDTYSSEKYSINIPDEIPVTEVDFSQKSCKNDNIDSDFAKNYKNHPTCEVKIGTSEFEKVDEGIKDSWKKTTSEDENSSELEVCNTSLPIRQTSQSSYNVQPTFASRFLQENRKVAKAVLAIAFVTALVMYLTSLIIVKTENSY